MTRGEIGRRIGAGLAGLVGCAVLAGCGGTQGFEAQREPTYSLSSLGSKLGNLVAFNKLFPESAPLAQTEAPVECPTIEVQDGTASVRVYSGEQTNDRVRYGFALGDIARECSRNGDLLTLKVGAEGRVLLGPTGAPGTFTVPLRVAVRNDATQKVVTSFMTRVTATVQSGETQAGFSYVSEPFTVPMVVHPDEDYVILVGFDPNGKDAAPKTARRTRKR